MKPITKLNPALCPLACAEIARRLEEAHAEGREIAIFRGLAYAATVDGIWHVALREVGFDGSPIQAYENTWTDADFGFPAESAEPVSATQNEAEAGASHVSPSKTLTLAAFLAGHPNLSTHQFPSGAVQLFNYSRLGYDAQWDMWHLADYAVSSIGSGPSAVMVPRNA